MTRHGNLQGAFPVLPTIFHDGGAIDEAGFERVVDFTLACGSDGVVFPGLASEYDMLALDERLGLIGRAGSLAAGRAAFVVGAGATTLDETLTLAQAGAAAGASAVMLMTPARHDGDPDALARCYETVGARSGLPIILQNAPRPMGLALDVSALAEVVGATPAVTWVKEENMPCGQRITALLDCGVPTLRGIFGGAGGRYITDELARGAVGTMPAAELPELNVALMAAHRDGNSDRVRQLYEAMLPVLMLQAIFRWDLTKEVLRRRGLIAHRYTRAVGPRLDAGDLAELTRVLARLTTVTALSDDTFSVAA